MADRRVDDHRMEEVVEQPPLTTIFDYDEVVTKKEGLEAEITTLRTIIADVDILIARLDAVGCKKREAQVIE